VVLTRAIVAVLVVLAAGCTDSDTGSGSQGPDASDGASTTEPRPQSDPEPRPEPGPGGRGPRALPPTFVELELDAFPRPADEACADNDRVIDVDDGAGLSRAVREAEPGTTIRVAPGTYVDANDDDYRALAFEQPDVCLRAAEVPGPGAAVPTVVVEPDDGQTLGVASAAGGVVIEGVELRGFEVGVAIEAEDEGETLEGITLESVAVREPVGDFREGIVSYGDNRELDGAPAAVDGLLLLDVSVEGADLGISCNAGPCSHWWLDGVSVTGRQGSEDSGADAVAVEEGSQIVVVDSRVEGAAADGIDTKATDVVIHRTTVRDVARNGIKLWEGGDVVNSVVDGSGADAALVGEGPARYRYLHVLVTRHAPGEEAYVGTWGFDTGEPVELEIVNSIFAGNAPGGFYVPEGSTVSIRTTIFDDPDAGFLDVGDVESFEVGDLAELEDRGWVDGVLVADPELVDPAGGDLRTAETSPARDAAEPTDGLEQDLVGNPRSGGAGPDIGPVES
jgi:hypothetical protein